MVPLYSKLKLCNSFVLQFGALTPLEPRLGKKLIEPLTNLIHR